MSDSEDREERLQALRSRVKEELTEEGVIEAEEEPDESSSLTLTDRIQRRRRRMQRVRQKKRQEARSLAAAGVDPMTARLPSRIREHAEDSMVLNLAVLLIIVGSVIGGASGALLISADPRDLVASSVFSSQTDTDVHGLILTQPDSENQTGGQGLEGVDIEIIRVSDGKSEGRTETNSEGRFSFTEVSREDLLLRVEMDGYVTIERHLYPGEDPDLTLTLVEGDGIDADDLRNPSNLFAAIQLSTAIATLTLISAAIGVVGGLEARRKQRYRRTQWLCGLGLFSRGGIFFGSLLILLGMALLMLAKGQFDDQSSD